MIIFFKNIYHFCLAWLGNILYWFPSKKIFVLGVTGTKGKSTTLELINAILEAAGYKTALLSSLRFKIDKNDRKNDTSMTMPGRFFIQKFLRKAVNKRCRYALIEVTSQGILQYRHYFIDWDAALFTNVKPEHIEVHGSFENYRQTKVDFFKYIAQKSDKSPKFFLLNDEDPSKSYFVNAVNGSGDIIYFSRENFIEKELDGGKESIGDWLSSNFNLENAAAASAFAKSQNIQWPLIRKTLGSFKGVPGRLETIQQEPFKVIIDYAHTPDSLEKIYQTLANSKLICVLGAAGGGRDKWKRPVMGKIASDYCQQIILTDEDPYNENPSQILSEIRSGISNSHPPAGGPISNVFEILDRRQAIKKAISLAKKRDTVIITGKGSESCIHVAHSKKIPWDEKKAVKELLGML